MKNQNKTVCFTGHRPKHLCGYDRKAYLDFSNELEKIITDLYENQNARTFITGGAQGFDQLAFWAVNRLCEQGLKVENIVYIPFAGQQFEWNEHGIFGRREYRLMLETASDIRIISPGLNPWNVEFRAKPYDTRTASLNKAYNKRNYNIVYDSDIIVALYNPYQEQNSGTSETVKYAQTLDKEIIALSYSTDDDQLKIKQKLFLK